MSRNISPHHQTTAFDGLLSIEKQRLWRTADRPQRLVFWAFWVCVVLLVLWSGNAFAWGVEEAAADYVTGLVSPGNLIAGFVGGIVVTVAAVAFFNFVLKHWIQAVKIGVLALLTLSILAFLGGL